MTDETIIEPIGLFDRKRSFKLDEAVDLIYLHVAKKEDLLSDQENIGIEKTGFVCGILHVNEEVELILKFLTGLTQVNKIEFEEKFEIINEK